MFELDGTHASAFPQAWNHCTICNRARISLHDFIKAKRAPSLSTKKMALQPLKVWWKATLARGGEALGLGDHLLGATCPPRLPSQGSPEFAHWVQDYTIDPPSGHVCFVILRRPALLPAARIDLAALQPSEKLCCPGTKGRLAPRPTHRPLRR